MVEKKDRVVVLTVKGVNFGLVNREDLAENARAFSAAAKEKGIRPGQILTGINGDVSSDVLATIITVLYRNIK